MNTEAYQCLYDSLILVHTNNREGHCEKIVYHSLRNYFDADESFEILEQVSYNTREL